MPAPRARSSMEISLSVRSSSSRSAVARIAICRSSPEGRGVRRPLDVPAWIAGEPARIRGLYTLSSLSTYCWHLRRGVDTLTLTSGSLGEVRRRHAARPRRCADRWRRLVRDRRSLPPAAAVPGQDVRDPGGPRGDRRHLGSVPLSRYPLGLGHVHARLLVSPVDGCK